LRVEGDFSFTKPVGQKLDKTENFVQFEPKGAYPEDAPARLIPELLDRLAALPQGIPQQVPDSSQIAIPEGYAYCG